MWTRAKAKKSLRRSRARGLRKELADLRAKAALLAREAEAIRKQSEVLQTHLQRVIREANPPPIRRPD